MNQKFRLKEVEIDGYYFPPIDGSPNYNAYWVNGFEERERIYTCCDPADYGLASYYWLTKSVRYLDADKKELPKNIIVWMSKYIINQ